MKNILVVMATTVRKQRLDKMYVLYHNRFVLFPNSRQIELLSS